MTVERRLWESDSSSIDHNISSFLAASKDETIILSSAGDVITCRCRDSAISSALSQERWTGYDWGAELAALCCKGEYDDLSAHLQESNFCGQFGTMRTASRKMSPRKSRIISSNGLLGGSPAEVAPLSPLQMMESPPRSKSSADAIARNRDRAFRVSPPKIETIESDEGSIVPIKSFDYSHFAEGGNDMLPESVERGKLLVTTKQSCSPHSGDAEKIPPATIANSLIHGVPTFMSSFMNVKINQVSAHPLGSHVLLISSDGILFSYGLNNHGQLGIGVKTNVSDAKKGYIMTPTIVTPLLENGGKALRAAAGVDHSLVLVMTEERRLVRSSSSTSHPHQELRNGDSQTETVMYHQIYGFGRNDSMKIGLVNPKKSLDDDANCISLPKRVALRCKVRPPSLDDDNDVLPPMGIFALEASETHSAALVRRASGDVELFMWGRALHGALGFGSTHIVESGDTRPLPRVVPVPTLVECLSRSSQRNDDTCLVQTPGIFEYPVSISLGRTCSIVVTSHGRCFSFGTSLDGMLGSGPSMLEADSPKELAFGQGVRIVSVSAGATHVLALTDGGVVYTWGRRIPSSGDDLVETLTREDQLVAMDVDWYPLRLVVDDIAAEEEKKDDLCTAKIVEVCAGFDSSILLADTGRVFSYGKTSGRLGLGETRHDVRSPQPVFGGLRLWQEHTLRKAANYAGRALPQTPNKVDLKRGFSTSAI